MKLRAKHIDCRTEKRYERVRTVLEKRQPTLTVILENINDPHNVSAILRSCDAVGIIDVHLVYTGRQSMPKFGVKSSASALKWVKAHKYESIEECYSYIRSEGKKIYTTHLSSESISLYDLDLTLPTALVFGNEHLGISEEALHMADGNFLIPQTGMIQSLNISVAAAVSLYEAFRQRKAIRMYDNIQISEDLYENMSKEWLSK